MSRPDTPYRAGITGVGHFFPENTVDNHQLSELVDTSDEWIRERTGIVERRFAAPGTGASELAEPACRDALAMAGLRADEIDCILLATVTPDTIFPSAACALQERLGARPAAAMDLSAACSGWVYALQVADSFVRCGSYRRVLVVGVDVMTAILDMSDRNTCVLFGDGAGATLVERLPPGEEGILDVLIGADGDGGKYLYMPAGGSKRPASAQTVANREHHVIQDGKAVFKAAVTGMAEITVEILERIGATGNDVKLFVPHQANLRIIDAARKRAGISPEQVMVTIDRYGNTTAATIPTSLSIAHAEGRLVPGDLVLTSTFGAGYTWGAAALRWGIGKR